MAKFVIFLCLALAITAQAGLLDGFKGKQEEIKQEIGNKIDEAIEKIKEAIEKTREFFKEQIEQARKIVEKITEEWRDARDEMNKEMEEAEARGQDIADCMEKQRVIENTVEKTVKSVSQCIEGQIQKTYNEMDELYETAEHLIDALRADYQKAANCDTLKCYLEAGADASVQTTAGTAKMIAQSYQLRMNVRKRFVTLPVTCGVQKLPELRDLLVEEYQEVKECLKYKDNE